jgi:hypothetical protein
MSVNTAGSPPVSTAPAETARAMLDDARPALLAAYAALSAREPAALPPVARAPVARIVAALALHVRDLAELRERLRGG